MRIPFKSSTNRVLLIVTLLTALMLAARSGRTQTFNGQKILAESPASLRTIITRISNSSVLIIGYENLNGGSVQIRIRDKRGTVLLEETKYKNAYAGRYDLASLLPGLYTVELKTPASRHVGTVRIDIPANGHSIAIIDQPSPAVAELVVKQ